MDSDKNEIKQLKCTFYLNKKCNLEVTSIITIVLPFYKLQEGLAPFLNIIFVSMLFYNYIQTMLQNVHAPSLHCFIYTVYSVPNINLIVTVMVIQVDNDWSFVDPSFAYFFEWTHLLSARNDRTSLV